MPNQISEDDISRLVHAFYGRVRKDEALGPVFNRAITDWPHHLEKLEAFWSSVMLTSGRYKGQPMVAHVRQAQAMTRENFARWLALWRQASADFLEPEAAAAFQEKAERIAESLQLGVQFYQQRNAEMNQRPTRGRSPLQGRKSSSRQPAFGPGYRPGPEKPD